MLNLSTSSKSGSSDFLPSMASITDVVNLNGLAVEAITDCVWSPVAFWYLCNTAAATAAKIANYAGFGLVTGIMVVVEFVYDNTAANATLNINDTGAKPIIHNGAAVPAKMIKSGDIVTMIYNGSQYVILNFCDYGDLDGDY